MAIPTGAKVYNVVRENMNEVYIPQMPVGTENNIAEVSNVLFNDSYSSMLNNFVNVLINRIALTIINNKNFSNPLAIFKKGSVPFGTDIQEIYENPAQAQPYELSNSAMAKLLSITDPDTHVAYYRRNRQDKYTKTISRAELQGAFQSWDKFENYITAITQSLYSGNFIDEFKYTKALMNGGYENGKIVTQIVQDPTTNEQNAKAFIKLVRSIYTKMKMPSTEYNAYSKFSGSKGSITTWTDPSRIVVIIPADVEASVDVDVLANAFNMSKTDFIGRVVEIDNFKNSNLKMIMCDESWLQIYDNLMRFDEFYNANVMAWNEYLHVWGTYALSPFANAIAFVTEDVKPVTSVSIGAENIDLSLSTNPTGETLEITLTPSDTTSVVNYTSSDEKIFTIEKVSNSSVKVTPVSVGNATLTAKAQNGVSDTAKVIVTE